MIKYFINNQRVKNKSQRQYETNQITNNHLHLFNNNNLNYLFQVYVILINQNKTLIWIRE
jgi:hypothetical protein